MRYRQLYSPSQGLKCFSERQVIRDFDAFLGNRKVVIVTVDEETLSKLIAKMESKSMSKFAGFTSWRTICKEYKCSMELEDYYKKYVKQKVLPNVNSRRPSTVLMACLSHLVNNSRQIFNIMKVAEPLSSLSKQACLNGNLDCTENIIKVMFQKTFGFSSIIEGKRKVTITVPDGDDEYFEPDETSDSQAFLQPVCTPRNSKWCEFCQREVINENCPDMLEHYRIFHRAEGYYQNGKDHRRESLTQYKECQVCIIDGKINQSMTKDEVLVHLEKYHLISSYTLKETPKSTDQWKCFFCEKFLPMDITRILEHLKSEHKSSNWYRSCQSKVIDRLDEVLVCLLCQNEMLGFQVLDSKASSLLHLFRKHNLKTSSDFHLGLSKTLGEIQFGYTVSQRFSSEDEEEFRPPSPNENIYRPISPIENDDIFRPILPRFSSKDEEGCRHPSPNENIYRPISPIENEDFGRCKLCNTRLKKKNILRHLMKVHPSTETPKSPEEYITTESEEDYQQARFEVIMMKQSIKGINESHEALKSPPHSYKRRNFQTSIGDRKSHRIHVENKEKKNTENKRKGKKVEQKRELSPILVPSGTTKKKEMKSVKITIDKKSFPPKLSTGVSSDLIKYGIVFQGPEKGDIDMKALKKIQINIRRKISSKPLPFQDEPVIRGLGDPRRLILPRRINEGINPMFARDGILVNSAGGDEAKDKVYEVQEIPSSKGNSNLTPEVNITCSREEFLSQDSGSLQDHFLPLEKHYDESASQWTCCFCNNLIIWTKIAIHVVSHHKAGSWLSSDCIHLLQLLDGKRVKCLLCYATFSKEIERIKMHLSLDHNFSYLVSKQCISKIHKQEPNNIKQDKRGGEESGPITETLPELEKRRNFLQNLLKELDNSSQIQGKENEDSEDVAVDNVGNREAHINFISRGDIEKVNPKQSSIPLPVPKPSNSSSSDPVSLPHPPSYLLTSNPIPLHLPFPPLTYPPLFDPSFPPPCHQFPTIPPLPRPPLQQVPYEQVILRHYRAKAPR